VRTIEFDIVSTLLIAMLVLFVGRMLAARVPVLRRLNIPAPVVGGGLVAVVLALVDGLLHLKLGFGLGLKDSLLLMFFTTVGLSADARMLVKGGPRLVVFLAVSVVLIVIQNLVGIGTTRLLDLHPIVGLLGGSITLVGGHGTGAAYAARLGEAMNLHGIMELTMACATAGLVLGAVLGGPVAEYLLKRHQLTASGPAMSEPAQANASDAPDDVVTAQSLINTLFVVLLCLGSGRSWRVRRRGRDSSFPISCSVCCSGSSSATPPPSPEASA
jgi:glutamate:Na+ symporter, ESS family